MAALGGRALCARAAIGGRAPSWWVSVRAGAATAVRLRRGAAGTAVSERGRHGGSRSAPRGFLLRVAAAEPRLPPWQRGSVVPGGCRPLCVPQHPRGREGLRRPEPRQCAGVAIKNRGVWWVKAGAESGV